MTYISYITNFQALITAIKIEMMSIETFILFMFLATERINLFIDRKVAEAKGNYITKGTHQKLCSPFNRPLMTRIQIETEFANN